MQLFCCCDCTKYDANNQCNYCQTKLKKYNNNGKKKKLSYPTGNWGIVTSCRGREWQKDITGHGSDKKWVITGPTEKSQDPVVVGKRNGLVNILITGISPVNTTKVY